MHIFLDVINRLAVGAPHSSPGDGMDVRGGRGFHASKESLKCTD